MKILVDGQTLCSPDLNRGIGTYFLSLLSHMAASKADSFVVTIPEGIDHLDLPETLTRNVSFVKAWYGDDRDSMLRELQYRQSLEAIVESEGIDIYWNPNPLMNNVVFAGILKGVRNVATVHDLIPLVFPDWYLDKLPAHVFTDYLSRLVKLPRFDAIIAVSQSTADDVVKYLNAPEARVSVIHEGVDGSYFDAPSADDLEEVAGRYAISGDFIFTLGGSDPRKNNDNLVRAFSKLVTGFDRDLSLVLGGVYDIKTKEGLKRLAAEGGVEDRVIFTGHIPDGDLRAFYNLCSIFVFPTFYEGFGLPVVEAMAVGKPVVASKRSSLEEVMGEAGLYFDPDDPEDMAASMNKVIADEDLALALSKAAVERARGFDWVEAASQTLRLFKSLKKPRVRSGPAKKPARRVKTPRLAVFTPLSPQPSGIADYNETLLMHLMKYAEIDLFVDSITPNNPDIIDNFRYYDVKEFESVRATTRYDNIIYHMGNNVLHRYIYETLMRYPGITVLHDYNIHPFIREVTCADGKYEEYYSALRQCYGVVGDNLVNRYKKKNFEMDVYRFPMNEKVVEASKAVIVHNEWAKRELDSEKVHVVPLGATIEPQPTPEEVSAIRVRRKIPEDCFMMACFGDIVQTKRIESIIKAFSIFRLFSEQSRLYLVGRVYPYMDEVVKRLIWRYGLEDAVTVTGRVELDIFKEYMKAADVVLNLRYPTMGESSASLLGVMSQGKPVIISNINQFAEFPDDCCLKVDITSSEVDTIVRHLFELHDPTLGKRIGAEARRYVKETSSFDKVAAMIMDVVSKY